MAEFSHYAERVGAFVLGQERFLYGAVAAGELAAPGAGEGLEPGQL
ncbi:hypothetical protein OG698_40990 [Streptomyces sp. NBC_01003]|nr:hypothetical protein OG698_40990 [Streptomyces sp. NBC_01003]